MKIVIVSGIQIINNPRVVKEANALSSVGYEVEVIGAIFDTISKGRIECITRNVNWRHIPVIDLTNNGWHQKSLFFFSRLRKKLSLIIRKYLGIESYHQLGYFPDRLLAISKQRKADLYIVHLEQALWVGKKLLKNGKKVAIDIEDWYSEDGLPEDRKIRPRNLMRNCEKYLLRNSAYRTTTSHVLSKALQESYCCPAIDVVFNSFPLQDFGSLDGKTLDRKNSGIPSIIWFSQTIGPGRGLEQLIEALNKTESCFELHIRGTSRKNYKEKLLSLASDRVAINIHIHEQVPQHELYSRLIEHDIGYCGELSECRNHDLTISNKMMEYLKSGLAVLATDTQGQTEVQKKSPECVFVFKQNSNTSLVHSLDLLVSNSSVIREAKKTARSNFEKHFKWEFSSRNIVNLANKALSHSS